MSFLLLPEDEAEFVNHLAGLGMRLLRDDHIPKRGIARRRTPNLAADPLKALPSTLPSRTNPRSSDVRQLLFWRDDMGDLVALGDPGRASDPVSRVGLALSKSASARWQDALDQDRSALIRWRRCYWRQSGYLTPGLLQGMAAKLRLWPPELTKVYRSIERWLRKDAMKFDAFDYCPDPPVPPPVNRAAFVVWARPGAAAWLRTGGKVWPWTA